MATTTSNFGFTLPAVNSAVDEDLWGAQLNTNFSNLDSYLATRTANYDFADFELQNALIKASAEKTNDLGSVSGDLAIDYDDGNFQFGTISGNVTDISVSNWPTSGKSAYLTLELTWDGTGGHSFAIADSAFKTVNGTDLEPVTTANAVNEFYLRSRDGGTTVKIDLNAGYS